MTETRDCLIEIGTEELPPTALKGLIAAFASTTAGALANRNLTHGEVDTFATPRRLALIIRGLAVAQPDVVEDRLGPAVAAAFDDDGHPTKAALGFASSCGITVDDLVQVDAPKGKRLAHRQKKKGEPTADLLPAIFEEALEALPAQRKMRWGANQLEFVRPVRWVALLFDQAGTNLQILGMPCGPSTRGHRFMSDGDIKITSIREYEEILHAAHVVASFEKRRTMIGEELRAKAVELGGDAVIDEALLDEVTSLVEWPVVLAGSFEDEYLRLPEEVLISAMKKHQRYFHITDRDGALLPRFLTVANIVSSDPTAVAAGNERVIRPRLADAAFFYDRDSSEPLEGRLEALKGVVFQSKLGSYHDKVLRITALAEHIANELDADATKARRAALLAKCDLVTDMVGEFPDLQGTMGHYYSTAAGEDEAVAAAIKEQYLPAFSGDRIPASMTGRIISLADRLDTLVGLFGIGQPPTGSRDPFALRRAAIGVYRIFIEGNLEIDLSGCLRRAASLYAREGFETETVQSYILDRLANAYQEEGVPVEVFAAVRAVLGDQVLLTDVPKRVAAVDHFRSSAAAGPLAEANKRVANILSKSNTGIEAVFDVDHLAEPAERALYEALAAKDEEVSPLIGAADYQASLTALSELQQPIATFFDEVMVMADDVALRANRLALLQRLRALFLAVADISLLPNA